MQVLTNSHAYMHMDFCMPLYACSGREAKAAQIARRAPARQLPSTVNHNKKKQNQTKSTIQHTQLSNTLRTVFGVK